MLKGLDEQLEVLVLLSTIKASSPHKWWPWKWLLMCAFTYIYIYSKSSSKTSFLGINSYLSCRELEAQFWEKAGICSWRSMLRFFRYCLWRFGYLVVQELCLPRIWNRSRLKLRLLLSWKPSYKTGARLLKIYKYICILCIFKYFHHSFLGCHKVSYMAFILIHSWFYNTPGVKNLTWDDEVSLCRVKKQIWEFQMRS